MHIPATQSKSTYSYAIAPLMEGGVFGPWGVFAFMVIVRIGDLYSDHKMLPPVIAGVMLYVFHHITKDLKPGQIPQALSLYIGGMSKTNNSILRPIATFFSKTYEHGAASTYKTIPAPTLRNHYEP